MLNITEIEKYIDVAVEMFLQLYPDAIVPQIVVCPASRRNIIRNRTLKECGLEYKDDDRETGAEVISGPLDTKIIIYQARVKTEGMVRHCIWHELGHIIFGDEKTFNIDLNKDTPLLSGYGIFNEFIAEYIAYTVNDFKPLSGTFGVNGYLSNALLNDYCDIDQYWLSRYYAIVIGDSTISDEEFYRGKELVPNDIWVETINLMKILFEQTDKDEFWKVDTKYLEEVGEQYEYLFHIVFTRKRGLN